MQRNDPKLHLKNHSGRIRTEGSRWEMHAETPFGDFWLTCIWQRGLADIYLVEAPGLYRTWMTEALAASELQAWFVKLWRRAGKPALSSMPVAEKPRQVALLFEVQP